MGSDMISVALQDVQHALNDLMPDLRRFSQALTQSEVAGELVQMAYALAFSRSEPLAVIEQAAS
jgi:hypothetical protein